MSIPTEPIGSVPRPPELIEAMQAFSTGLISPERYAEIAHGAIADTIRCFEDTGSPVITDGEQMKPSFATYPIQGLPNLTPDGVVIPFSDGHTRRLPRLTSGPFRYQTMAVSYYKAAKPLTRVPLKQAVISASALSLLYPRERIDHYPREAFLEDLMREAEADIRTCLEAGAYNVQIDFTEARLSLKLDPSRGLLREFVALNNHILGRFSTEDLQRIGVHTCPGGDRDATHSADIDYAELLPDLFELQATNFYIQMASEQDRPRVLTIIARCAKPYQRIFIGVTDPINPRVETAEEVKERVLEAAVHIPVTQLGTTDDCGFSPFSDDTSTGRKTAFSKIRARVAGTEMAAACLGI